MTPKLGGYIGIGVAIVALIGVVLWQANSLMSKGVKLGEAQAIEKDLRGTLKEERDTHKEEIETLTTSITKCKDDVLKAVELGETWKTEFDKIKHRPPKKETIVLESTGCTDGLVEAHFKLKERIERRSRDEIPN